MEHDRLPQPLERASQTLRARAVEVLRDMVVTGRLRPGERLNEVELANALGISRGPLREAIQRLSSEGLVTTVPNRGSYVRTFTAVQLRELYEVRIALETHAVRLAATKANTEAMRELRQLLADTEDSLTTGEGFPRDLDFHRRFVAASDNQSLCDATSEVHRQVGLARSVSANDAAWARTALAEHRVIVEHLVNGRGEGAAKALAKHLRAAVENVVLTLKSGSGKPSPETPSPENPSPGKPSPENPSPGKPSPENPSPENPSPGKPSPEKPAAGR